jgi:hypothetical protein
MRSDDWLLVSLGDVKDPTGEPGAAWFGVKSSLGNGVAKSQSVRRLLFRPGGAS